MACDGSGRNPARTRARATRRGGRVVRGRVRRGRARRALAARVADRFAPGGHRARAAERRNFFARAVHRPAHFEPRRPSRPSPRTVPRAVGAATGRDLSERCVALRLAYVAFRPRRRIRRRVDEAHSLARNRANAGAPATFRPTSRSVRERRVPSTDASRSSSCAGSSSRRPRRNASGASRVSPRAASASPPPYRPSPPYRPPRASTRESTAS